MNRLLTAVLFLAALPASAAPQTPPVLFRGRGDPALDVRIRDLLRDSGRQLWTRDTLIARNDTVREPLLVVGATIRLEGVLAGDVAAVGADFFVRPNARVEGDVFSLAGGWYASDLATVSGHVDNRPNAPYDVEYAAEQRIIRGTRNPRLLALRPLVPMYDRVNGLSAGARADVLLPALGRLEPGLSAWGTYRSERGELDGGAAATLARGRTSLTGGVERSTLTNEQWIRGDLGNAVSYLFLGKDYRDYYEVERAWVELRRGLERGERVTEVWLRGQIEDARTLRADQPWSLFEKDSIRPNRPADDGRVSSVLAGATLAWKRPSFETAIEAATEFALDALDSDFTFAGYRVDVDWAMLALADHTLEIDAHLQGPLPGWDEGCTNCTGPLHRLPLQRWSHVGGSGTLYTFQDAAFAGDRVVFVESRYGIPLGTPLRVPLLGIPTLDLLHATGMAWTREDRRNFEQNLGFRFRFNVAYFRLVANPEDLTGDYEFSVGFTFPKRAYAWQDAGGFF